MICAKFYRKNNSLCGFSVSGHAGYADAGEDIVCASVTSAVQLTCNAVTEVLDIKAKVQVLEEEISLKLPEKCDSNAFLFVSSLELHLRVLSETYPGTITVEILEV